MIILIIFLLLFGAWFTISYLKLKKWTGRKQRCTLRIHVQVIEILTKKPGKGSSLLCKPIFKICSIKNAPTINSALYTSLFTFNIGQELWLRVNPENIQDFMYESPYNDIIIFLDALGCVLLFIVLVIGFIAGLCS